MSTENEAPERNIPQLAASTSISTADEANDDASVEPPLTQAERLAWLTAEARSDLARAMNWLDKSLGQKSIRSAVIDNDGKRGAKEEDSTGRVDEEQQREGEPKVVSDGDGDDLTEAERLQWIMGEARADLAKARQCVNDHVRSIVGEFRTSDMEIGRKKIMSEDEESVNSGARGIRTNIFGSLLLLTSGGGGCLTENSSSRATFEPGEKTKWLMQEARSDLGKAMALIHTFLSGESKRSQEKIRPYMCTSGGGCTDGYPEERERTSSSLDNSK